MIKKYSLVLITFLCSFLYGFGQQQIYILDFESVGGYTTSVPEFTDNAEDYFIRTDGISNIDETQVVLANQQDSFYFGVNDTDADGGPSNLSLNISGINISGYTNLELRIFLAEDDDGTNQDWDADSYMHIIGAIDAGTSQDILWVEAAGGTNTEPRLDTNFDGLGNGTPITDSFAQVTSGFTGSGSNLDLQIIFNNLNQNDVDIAIDNIEIWGVSSCTDAMDFANIQSPTASPQNINEGDTFNVFTQAVEPGITNANATAPGVGVEAWIGYSSTNDDPSTGTGWTWVTATYSSDVGANDVFVAEIGSGLAPGTYYYACRYRLNNCGFTYGGVGHPWNNDSVELIVTSTSSCTPIFTDNFSSGLGSWSNAGDWTINGGELQHNFAGGTDGDSYIYTDLGAQNLAVGNYEWNFCMRNDNWDPSTNNNFTYYLISDSPTYLDVNTVNGYAVGINRTGTAANDAITLYDVSGGNHSALISTFGSFDWNNNDDVCIRVTRNAAGDWELFYNPNGTGEVSAGTITDNSHTTGQYTGAFFEFTSSNANELWVDDISICSDITVIGPELQLVAASSDVSCGYTLDFGNVESDGSTLDLSVFVDNEGSTALDINSLTIAGGDAADFSIVSPAGGFPISIAPGTTQEVVIRFTSNTNGLRTSTLTIDNTDGSDANDETMCTVILNGTGITNAGGGDLMITQYYEGSGLNKWIEIVNVSGSAISAGSYYLATYNKGGAPNYTERPLNGTPNASVSIPAMAIDEIIRFKEPATTVPGYAVPGEAGYDGNPTSNMMVASFSGNDIIIISTTNDASSYTNRIDIIGEYSPDGENWGNRSCFIRKECVASNPSITFDIDEWIEFTDAEVETPTNGTNPYLGQHFRGTTEYTGVGAFNGWDNGLPERSRIAEVGSDYLTGSTSIGSFESCSLTINTGTTLDIENGDYVSIVTDLTVDNTATLEIRNEGQLVMIEDTGVVTNNGNTNVRKTTAVMNQFDYVYWSAPIDYDISPLPPLTIDAVLTEFNPTRMYRFNTATYNDANNDTFDDDGNDWAFYSSDMIKGVGYATMTANTSPQANNAVFNGKVNNGIISVNLALSADANGDTDNDEDDWNLVGNPYPSAISADSLITQNTNINGTVYFWTHNTPISISNPGPDTFNFGTNDYAMYNLSGGVGTGTAASTGGTAPTGHIASGQGFFVDAITATPLTFNNSMRSINLSNDDFFRNANDTSDTIVEKDRMWLNLTNSDGALSQLLIGFFNEATNGKDRLYDGVRLSGSNYVDFFSFDETLHEYGIQGRSTFDQNDVIPLGYNSHILGSLSIELANREGLLLDTPIYLVDTYLNTTHDLTISPYVFTTSEGKYNDRFEIVFTLDSLSDNEFEIDDNALSIIEDVNGLVTFKLNGNHTIEAIEILDILGKTVYKLTADNSQETYNLSKLSQGTYIAKVTLDNGFVITKKSVKRR